MDEGLSAENGPSIPLPSDPGATGASCAVHPGRPARWTCSECQRPLCSECTQTIRLDGSGTVTLCRACHAVCEPFGTTSTAPEKAFAQGLLESFAYPFRGSALVVLLSVVGADAVLSLLGGYFALLGLAVGVYVATYLRAVLLGAARGESETAPPEMDSATLREAAVQFFAVYFVCFGPWTVLRLWTRSDATGLQVWPWALLAAGACYFPMALLAVVIYDSVAALNPVLVLLSIAKVPLRYLGLLLLAGALAGMAWLAPWYLARGWTARGASVVGGFVSLYASVVFVRALGWFYSCSEETLGWS